MHGVFLSIFNKGVLLQGESGIGKSECALALIDRGHQLICDDAPCFSLRDNIVVGSAGSLGSLLEVRGLGIIDVCSHFGKKAHVQSAPLELIICLEKPNCLTEYERPLESKFSTKQILNVPIPSLCVSVMLKFHLAILVETAVRTLFAPTSALLQQVLTPEA